MNLNRDGLTDAEFDEAIGLAVVLARRCGVNEFYSECEFLAKNRYLTRKQLECLRRNLKTRAWEHQTAKPRIARGRSGISRKKVTLATVALDD